MLFSENVCKRKSYTNELCEIATLMGKHKGITFDAEATEKLETVFEDAQNQSDFGNGRYVRNVLEQAKMNQASRLLEYDFDDITTEEIAIIKAVDIVVPDIKTEEKQKMDCVVSTKNGALEIV